MSRPYHRPLRLVAGVALAALLLGGCTTVKNLFDGRGKDKSLEPTPLVQITPSVNVARLWSASIGGGEKSLGMGQHPAIADGRVYAAAVDGGVHALDLKTGQSVWRYASELPLSGGPGAGEGLVVVGSLGGDVIALDAGNGSERWRARVNSEVITAPLVAQGHVFVRGNDGRITALDAANGERRWFSEQELPSLTVRGNAPLAWGPGVLFSGNDEGTLTALGMQDGRVLWKQAVGLAEGRSELDRMADVDSGPLIDGVMLFASSFRNRTIAIDGPSGRPMWQSDHGGIGGMAVSPYGVLVSSPAGTVYLLDRNNGAALWSQPVLARRSLTGAAVQGDYAVVGDIEGYLHWMRLSDGEMAARERSGRKPIKGQPLVADDILLVQTIDGELNAFRLD